MNCISSNQPQGFQVLVTMDSIQQNSNQDISIIEVNKRINMENLARMIPKNEKLKIREGQEAGLEWVQPESDQDPFIFIDPDLKPNSKGLKFLIRPLPLVC